MNPAHAIAVFAAVFVAAGCQPSAAPAGGQVASSPSVSVPPPPPGSDASGSTGGNTAGASVPQAALVAAYRAAHERKDVEAILKLYCLDGASADVRDVTRENIEHELRHPIAAVQIGAALEATNASQEGGVRWRPSLPEVARVTVDYDTSRKSPGEMAVSQAVFSVGMKRGRCYFTVPVREN
jgi:hypothetical protein